MGRRFRKNKGKNSRLGGTQSDIQMGTLSSDVKDDSENETPLYEYGRHVLISSSTNRPIKDAKVQANRRHTLMYWCEVCDIKLRNGDDGIHHLIGKDHKRKKEQVDALNRLEAAAKSLEKSREAAALGNVYVDCNQKTGQKRGGENLADSSHSTFQSKTQVHYAGKKHKGTLNLEESENCRANAGVSWSSATSLRSDFSPLPAFREELNKNFNPYREGFTSAQHHQRTQQPSSEIGKNLMRAAGSVVQSLLNGSGNIAAGSSYGERNDMSFDNVRVQEYGSFDDDERRSWQSNLYPSSAVYDRFYTN